MIHRSMKPHHWMTQLEKPLKRRSPPLPRIPGPRGGWLTVYIVAPVIGALAGGGLYRLLAGRLLAEPEPGSSA